MASSIRPSVPTCSTPRQPVDVAPDQDGYANSGLYSWSPVLIRTVQPGETIDVTQFLWTYGGFTVTGSAVMYARGI